MDEIAMAHKYLHQVTTAVSFGLTSGVISAIGMIVGLNSATSSKVTVIAGIMIMAIADGLADAAGMHLSEEAETDRGRAKHTRKEVWITTLLTLFSVVGVVITFVIPILIFALGTAVLIAIGWGLLLLVILNYYIARVKNENPARLIFEHLLLAVALILISDLVGVLIASWFR
jgi:VIT1/CCC1 family predicted Fe2+/Mn2+ transporter